MRQKWNAVCAPGSDRPTTVDDPVLRQAIEKQMDRIELVHRFTRPSQWATRRNSSRRKKKTRRWPKPASGSSRTAFSAGIISICRGTWKSLRIPRAARRFSTRWPTARRLPGDTSTCSASMISRQKSCGTASGSGSQNWGAKKVVFLDLIQTHKPQCTEGIR
jgi:hypothetical protein